MMFLSLIRPRALLLAALVLSGCGGASGGPLLRGRDRKPVCAERNPERTPFFGDLHVHTKNSFDAASYDVRNGPREAYRFARGEAVGLPPHDENGTPARSVQLDRPLDFAAVTDHSEFLAETTICLDPTLEGYDSRTCQSYRDGIPTGRAYTVLGVFLAPTPPFRPEFCLEGYCIPTIETVWEDSWDAAEEMYDRSSDCNFTTFVAYEWTGSSGASNWHRNVIFRSRTVPRVPISFFEATNPELLYDALTAQCLDADEDCDVLVIPHNGNQSAGRLFVPERPDGTPYEAADARRRRAMEPLVEVYQHKGASECTPGGLDPLGSDDPECAFELLIPNVCSGDPGDAPDCKPICPEGGGFGGFLGTCISPNDFARGALRNGLSERERMGETPFQMGFIGSTDTHNGTPGAVEEDAWEGHTGTQDSTPSRRLPADALVQVTTARASPGGLAVIWAEENTRDSLFDAMRRRETYATSGTRITLRTFGGFGFTPAICSDPGLVANGYANGVPMGGELPPYPGTGAPTFVISVLRDPEGAPIRVVQVVKGWHDGATTHEVVYDVAGMANNGAGVDTATCEPSGAGLDAACTVFTDPDFDPSESAFYYVRVLENPTCRWSHRLCVEAGVDCATQAEDDPMRACCTAGLPETISERAWSSPIWYLPPT